MVACLRFTVSSQLDVPCRWQATAVGKSGEDYERPTPLQEVHERARFPLAMRTLLLN
jgi:hypothetical protein